MHGSASRAGCCRTRSLSGDGMVTSCVRPRRESIDSTRYCEPRLSTCEGVRHTVGECGTG
eukprot:scaffold16255_cov69-Phaeocystis_antarctica.AAC.3